MFFNEAKAFSPKKYAKYSYFNRLVLSSVLNLQNKSKNIEKFSIAKDKK